MKDRVSGYQSSQIPWNDYTTLTLSQWFLSRSLQAKILSWLSNLLSKILPLQRHPMPSLLRNKLSWHDLPSLSLSLSLSLWGLYICTSPPTWWTIHHSTIIEIKWLNLISNLSMLFKPQRCFTVILKGYFIQISNHMILKWETNYFL